MKDFSCLLIPASGVQVPVIHAPTTPAAIAALDSISKALLVNSVLLAASLATVPQFALSA
jgi:hypothetical protein